DVQQTHTTTAQRQAYYAAQAAIQVYLEKLRSNPNYWTECPKVSEAAVPGSTSAKYSYETMPSSTASACESGKLTTIVESAAKTANGTFRVKATGKAVGGVTKTGTTWYEERTIVATLDHAGYLNYVFLSNFEVEDPTTLPSKPKNCDHYYEQRKAEGRLKECPPIDFIEEDELDGPFHTNDGVAISGKPSFGRTEAERGHPAEDVVEMGEGWYTEFGGGEPEFRGTYVKGGATLLPPETDEELLQTAGYKFKGRTTLELIEGSPNKVKGTTYNEKGEMQEYEKPFPTNGVVYVENNTKAGACTLEYSPFSYDKNYEEEKKTPTCGDVYVSGKYTESLTIASQHDIVIAGPITTTHEGSELKGKPTGAATLGLIANDFVRVYHPVKSTGSGKNNSTSCEGDNQNASEDPLKYGSHENLVVDAAILSTKNSWIVDNFTCGKSLNELIVWGAIAQNWRGRVTQGGSGGGYPHKNYKYDERMKTEQPPSFLAPSTTGGWTIQRETE
ncbi:MAG: hypothetical protein ACLQMH_17775, partial [Solirubrobacteraceae bacterium]